MFPGWPPATPAQACRAGSWGSWSACHPLSRRRQRRIAAVALEPAHHIELRPHPIRRARSGAVVFLIEAQQCGRDTAVLECLVELLALGDGRAPVQFTGHDQGGCFDVADMHERGLLQPIGGILPEWLLEKAVGKE